MMPEGEAAVLTTQAFEATNSRAYVRAVFEAWAEGYVVASLPPGALERPIAGADIVRRRRYDPDPGWFEAEYTSGPATAPSQIAFSSGTTGTPKALVLSHGGQADVVTRINAAMQVTSDIREYVGVPVSYSFGFGRMRAVSAAGGRAFLPKNGFDPSEIGRMLHAGEINAVSAVPTLWRIVLANPDVIGTAGRSLHWIEIGSQFMAAGEKEALRQIFPNARIVQHYGLTEASRSTLLDISEAPTEYLASVGRATGDVAIGLSPSGEIRIKGPHVALGRLTDTGIEPILDTDGWLTTTDRGTIEDGWLFYQGRTDEVINCGGLKIDPNQFEQRLLNALDIPGGLAVGRMADPLRGEQVLIVQTPQVTHSRAEVEEAALQVAAQFGLTGRGVFRLEHADALPVTSTGKIRRALLETLVTEQAPAAVPPAAPPDDTYGSGTTDRPGDTDKARTMQALWAEALRIAPEDVNPDRSFYEQGGDSLSALTLILQMEAAGLDPETARKIFDGQTIRALVGGAAPDPDAGAAHHSTPAETPQATGTRLSLAEMMNAVHAIRGLLILWVIVVHWSPGVLLRLGEGAIALYGVALPAFRFGTPGFAMVFGLSIGALRIAQYRDHPERAAALARRNILLIGGGVLLLALVRWLDVLTGTAVTPGFLMSRLFYSSIIYYAIAVACTPLLLRLVANRPHPSLWMMSLVVLCLWIDEVLQVTLAPLALTGTAELLKVMISAKYGIFKMTAYVLIGAAIGYELRQRYDQPGIAATLFAWGATLTAAGFLILYIAQPDAMFVGFGAVRPWHLTIFTGVMMLLLSGFLTLNAGAQTRLRALRGINRFLIASGILSLPLFVGHQMVLPAKDVLANTLLSQGMALGLVLGVFLGLCIWGYRRLMRLVG